MATAPKMATTSRPPELNPVEGQVLDIFRELLAELGSSRVAQNVSLFSSLDRDLGLGSLERVELLVRCEARFEVRLADDVAQRADTPAEWVRAVLEGSRDGASRTATPRYRIEPPIREASPAPDSATSWVEVLQRHAEIEPERVHVHLLDDDSGQDITYGQLFSTASRVAAGLIAAGLRRDETVAIMLPTSADFFYAFFGVMLAGGIAVPIYPPTRPDKIEEYVRRQVLILCNAEVRFLISFEQVKTVSRIMRLSIPSLLDAVTVASLIQTGNAVGSQNGTGVRLGGAIGPSDTAFIQYTSGSTGDPKGVVLSQSNVLANVRGIGWAVKFQPDDIVVSWLPLYHDMGLIGSWLFSLYFGGPITLLSPLSFLSRPERWLWALHDSRGTLCPAPNFAYELCARKIPHPVLEGLDLSCWRVAINAGEAVLPETLRRFAERFRPYGFRPESYVPCYGLAESSVALAFPPIGRSPVVDTILRDRFEREGRAVPARENDAGVLRFVANGQPLPGHAVRLLDEEGRDLGERVQGRLFFRGLSKTPGYYRNPGATVAVTTEDGWMDSGDLAYWAEGELFITGRVKDCIIKSGRNLIPQEVETAAAEVPEVRKGCVAAFGMTDAETGTERLVVVAETRAQRPDELRRIEGEIVKGIDIILGIPPDKVVLVSPQRIPKTSSGKIRRNETRRLYESGQLDSGTLPAWQQVGRLWLENLGAGIGLGIKRVSLGLRRAYHSTLWLVTTLPAGLLARLTPSKRMAGKIVRFAARVLVRLGGQPIIVNDAELGSEHRPAVLVANRAGPLDPLVLAATLSSPFLFADTAALSGLPRPGAFLLRPLPLPLLNGYEIPPGWPGGTLRQRIRRGLERGHHVLVLPDGPAGVPVHLSRFRLDALHAATATSGPILPIAVWGTASVLPLPNAKREKGKRKLEDGDRQEEPAARVIVGRSIQPTASHHKDIVALREVLRKTIAQLCFQPAPEARCGPARSPQPLSGKE